MFDGLLSGLQSLRQKIAQAVRFERDRGASTPVYEPTEDEKIVLALLEEPKRVREATLAHLGPVWERNILYAAGIQHVIWSDLTRKFEKPKAQDWLPLPVENMIQPKIAGAVDFFTRNRPDGQVIPTAEGGERARRAAAVGDKVRRYLYEINDDDDNYDEAATCLITLGNVFSRIWGRPLKGFGPRIPKYTETDEPLLDPATQQPMVGPDGQPVMTRRVMPEVDPTTGQPVYDDVPQVECCHTVLTPLQVTVPMQHRGPLKFSPWILEAGLYATAELRELYPRFAPYIGTGGKVVTSDLYMQRIGALVGQGAARAYRSIEPYALKGYGLVFFFERQPDADFRNGLFVVEYDGLPLVIDQLPLEDKYSYEHCGYHRVLSQFWFRGPVDDMIDPQNGVNRLEQSLQVNDAHNAQPVWLQHGDSETSPISGKPGTRIRWKGPAFAKPERVPGMDMPAQTLERKELYRQTIDKTSSLQDILFGKAPPGVVAGVALNMLGEDAERYLSPVTKRWDRYVERVETKKLEYTNKYYTIPRTLSVLGEDDALIEVRDFVGSDLDGGTKFRIVSGSYRPRSLAAMQSIVMELLGKGLLDAILQDPGQLQEILELLGLGRFRVKGSLDYERAKLENEMLASPESWMLVQRLPVDDDMVHLSVHDEVQKRPSWWQLPNEVQARYVRHSIEHLEAFVRAGGVGSGDLAQTPEEVDAGAEPVAALPGGGNGATKGEGARGMSDGSAQMAGA